MWQFGKRLGVSLRPFLPVIALCLLAIWPFISRASLPNNTDAELHVFRLAELSRLIRAGIFYPRWAPNFYFGYGYPIFNYYAPLSYYLGTAIDLLPVLGPVSGVKGVFILSLLASGAGTFALVRQIWGDRAGYLAAALYLYSPYIQYLDPHARGVLAESLSLGLLPCALAALLTLTKKPTRLAWLAAVFTIALALVAHNLMAMVFGGLFLGWIIWQAIFSKENGSIKPSLYPAGAFGLAILATSFFWLPVALERSLINIASVVGESGSHFDFAAHFLTLADLLQPVPLHDWGAISPHFTFTLGPVQAIFGLIGGIFWLVMEFTPQKYRPISLTQFQRSQGLFFTLAGVFLIFLMLPASSFLWETIPLLPFLQFPWRLLGPAALMAAAAGGSAAAALEKYFLPYAKPWATAASIGLVLLVAVPVAQVIPWEPFGGTSTADLTRQEMRGRWLGTTSTADFVPATVDVIPKSNDQLLNYLLQNQPPDRINYASIPPGGVVTWQSVNPLHQRFQTASPDPFLLRLFLFDFPGWMVTLDSRPVETEIGRPEGFLVVPVPAGEHVIDVRFGTTPARRWGWLLTGAAAFAAIFAAIRLPKTPITNRETAKSAPHRLQITILVLGIAVVLLPGRWLHLETTGEIKSGAGYPVQANFGDQIRLIGADIDPTTVDPGDSIDVTLYWKAVGPVGINYQSFVHLMTPEGVLTTQSDKLNPGDFPTRQWPSDKFVVDRYMLTIPENAQPGMYEIRTGLWVAAEGWRLPVFDLDGRQIGDTFLVTTIEIR